jgi:lysophospholipid acyltransferase (LPLAT)-like uncharacterized protein
MSATAAEARDRRRARRVRWSARVGAAVLRMLASTWRVRQVHDEGWRALRRQGAPWVFAVWHGDLLAAVCAHRGEGIAMLVSEHSDGEIIARIGAQFGQRTVRGSSSRGGSRALLGLVRALRDGVVVAVTPDGPRGPRHAVQPGVVAAAQRGEAPIIVIGVAYRRAWTLTSWDRFRVPMPFARIVLSYSAPYVPTGTVEEGAAEVGRLMAAMTAQATAALGDD